ncbi:MAG: hypothetical protein K8M05_11525, partial [Deltaproteobacteria bacterium]|nr:hypothetical protein [Kofleriaceae bacterium]
ARAKVAWYVRPPDVKTSVLVGATSRATWKPGLAVAAPASRASLRARVKVKPVGARIKVNPPDLDAAARARMSVKVGGDGRMVGRPAAIDHRAQGHGAVKGTVGAGVGAGLHRDARPDADAAAKAAADAKVKADIRAKADIKAKADVKLKAPPPPPPPKAKIEVKGKLDVKGALGN